MEEKQTNSRRSFLKSAAIAGALGAAAPWWLDLALKPLLRPEDASAATTPPSEQWVPTTCWIGKQDCGMLARIENGRIVKFEGHLDHPRNRGTLCPKGMAQIMAVYDPYRLKAPVKRTNAKGVSGTWQEISWDEALTLVASKITGISAADRLKYLVWQKGRSKAEALYDTAFVKACGALKLGHGAYCSDAGYRACEYTIGPQGVLHPDFHYTKYILSWGWNATNAGGNKFCWLTYNRQLADAKERGIKVVSLDPWRGGMGPHADEWLPIKPSTDLAFFLALAQVLIAEGYIDEVYLKNYTNAPFLVQADGRFLKVAGKAQVWDTVTASAKDFDATGVQPSLDGEYTVGTDQVKTAFRLYKEHVASHTPEWAAGICGLPAASIRRVAQEMGNNARIGSTIVVDGKTLPYRPVAIAGYHVAQQELGFVATRAALNVIMLLGAVEAVGSSRIDWKWKKDGKFDSSENIEATIIDPPYNIHLKDSKYFPINSANPGIVAKVMLNPGTYGVTAIPKVLLLHMTNPMAAYPDNPTIGQSYLLYEFIAVIDSYLSETADYYADVVLPAATIEKYEGPLNVTDQYEDATTLRLPPIPPLFQSKGEIDIYIDLCEKANILLGAGGYIDQINQALSLGTTYGLPLDVKPVVRDIFDRWAKKNGTTDGITYFEQNGVKLGGTVTAGSYYGYAKATPFDGIRHRLYGEGLLRGQDMMKLKGATQAYWQDYTPFPTWRAPTMDGSPAEYDLYLISRKKIEFKQSRATQNPLLAELGPVQTVLINPDTAQARGIADGDQVVVKSHNAVTGETRVLRVKAELSEAIRPDTVSMPHHYGKWVQPGTQAMGPTPNSIFFTGEGYVTNTQDQSYQVKVKVYKEA